MCGYTVVYTLANEQSPLHVEFIDIRPTCLIIPSFKPLNENRKTLGHH